MKQYDVIVIGSGMSGMTIASKCASKGLKVAVTDELPYGGTCALRGCDPKKIIIGATEVRDFAQRLAGKGINTIPEVDWKDIMAFKQEFVDAMPKKIEKGYKHNDIDTYHGAARFITNDSVKIESEILKGDKIVIATGARARQLKFEGGDHALTSTDFLNLQELPKSLIFIGGGYVAFEFAHIAKRCGAEVTIIHRGTRPLENFDKDIVHHLSEATQKLGVRLVLETNVIGIKKETNGYTVVGEKHFAETEFTAETVFNSAGRVPHINDLDLSAASISSNKRGVEVNEYLQSVSNPFIYAAGDSADTSGLPLTPVAVYEGHIVASNIIKENKKTPDYPSMPSVVFTLPAMASVELTEEEAKKKGLNIKINSNAVPEWFNAKRLNVQEYAYKTIIDTDKGTLLGVHLIGPGVEETINFFSLAMFKSIPVKDLKKMIYAYPTMGSDISSML
ncbi:NAD(P)/FAD-dependent oxidoreductase [Salegentibacter sp. JZCK2]|uniref:dihydrolipoyl dehydrogenase family protein n=1 Tax=Salegentibacter tibetensis TaxID=2873600 RepID=UPI001CCE1237|nr:NAD(P)/FAD-dependent oxidoreductase [Salegentibacter tibetensis]MBZ9730128.1 NAD(P)/FAD-dependent oxidoreductase [Salegentibacter tibetensis]